MNGIQAQFVGVELYFDDLEGAKEFYVGTLGLEISDEQVGHHAKFDSGAGFVCLERKGSEPYPSKDKAVLPKVTTYCCLKDQPEDAFTD